MEKHEVVEASTLGLPPGIWPVKVYWLGYSWMQQRTNATNGAIESVTYRRSDGRLLEVLND